MHNLRRNYLSVNFWSPVECLSSEVAFCASVVSVSLVDQFFIAFFSFFTWTTSVRCVIVFFYTSHWNNVIKFILIYSVLVNYFRSYQCIL